MAMKGERAPPSNTLPGGFGHTRSITTITQFTCLEREAEGGPIAQL